MTGAPRESTMAARRPWRMVTLVPALVLAAGACGQDADQETLSQPGSATASFSTGTTRAATAVPVPAGPPTQAELDRVAVRLERLARLRNPVAMAVAGDDTTLYVGERAGRVRAIRTGRLDPRPLLDLTDQVVVEGEGGLLGIAVAPAGQHLYVSFTDRRHAVRLVEVTLHGDRVDPASRRDILTVQQPSTRHHGGNIVFGPDRKSTRLNSSHVKTSYAVFCLKKKKDTQEHSVSYIVNNDIQTTITY